MSAPNKTLEGHLNSLKDKKAKELAAAWTLNKTKLTGVLSLITAAFPTYSLHDASHSETIIENIERLLGNKISKLGATDTFMLLMAAYTHDLGMYLSYKTIEDKWKTTDFAKKIKELENHRDPQIAKAAKLLRETQDKVNNPAAARKDDDDTMLWALEIKNAVTLLTIELFRGEHAKRSENYLNDDIEFAKLLGDIDQYGGMRATLAKIAYLHYEDFTKVFILEKEAKGFAGTTDVCHPRFVACMIRLGDLLDFDNNRFNSFAMAMVKEVPETSLVHYKKHCSTGGELSNISPTEIRVSFDCGKDDVYREAAKWKKMVEEELFNMHAYWSEIAPEESSGKLIIRLPSAKQIKIKLKYNGKENPNPALMNLRFDISSKKVFEMLKGGAIYKNPGRVFLREIVQNAMDATKLQIWKELKAGSHLPFKLHNPEREINTIDDIKFSDDIPTEVYDKYPITLSVEYLEKEEIIRVVCEDRGTGISEESLIRMTSQVGESRKADKGYEKTIKGMPYILQPTAAFGLGLQTVFYVADEFTMETAYPGEPSRRIVFRASTNGSYCSIEDENIGMHSGTKVIIDIDKDHFGYLFELEDKYIKELYDDKESMEYYIPGKIDSYIRGTFRQTENIPFFYQSQFCEFQSVRANKKYQHLKEEGDFRVSSRLIDLEEFYNNTKGEKSLIFRIEEKRYGSIIEICFRSWDYYMPIDRGLAFRDVKIDNSFLYVGYDHVRIKWNLFCREADAFVTISRDKLLPQGEAWCTEIMNSLMPDIIRLTHKSLLDELKKHNDDRCLREQFGSLCLIDWQMPETIINDYSPLEGLMLPLNWASNHKLESIYAKELFKTPKIISMKRAYLPDGGDDNKQMARIKERWSQAKPSIDNTIFCWEPFIDSIPSSFMCNKVVTLPWADSSLKDYYEFGYCLIKTIGSNPQLVEASPTYLNPFGSRTLLTGLKGYETIVVSNAPRLGKELPYHCNYWIYSLNDNGDFEFDVLYDTRSREELKQKLETEWIRKLVPDYIVKLIQKHNILQNDHLTEKEIYDTYIRLILDHKFGVEKTSE